MVFTISGPENKAMRGKEPWKELSNMLPEKPGG